MRSVEQSLMTGAEDLRSDLELADVLTEALVQRFSKDAHLLREYTRRARRLTYSSTIISCYGLIEQTVDLSLMSVIEAYNEFVPAFEDLPEVVRTQHRELILQLLRDGGRARTRRKVEEKDALRGLGLNGKDRPTLVPPVFTLSTANYRFPYVRLLFGRIGLEISSGLYRGRADDALARTGFANYESFLEDLVQRRNDLAHSPGDEEIVDRQLLEAYVDLTVSFLLDLIRLARLSAIKMIRDWRLEPIALVAKGWSTIIGIDIEAGRIAVGERIILFKEDWCTSHDVLELQSGGKRSDRFESIGSVVEVGVKIAEVPGNVEGAEVFLMPRDLAEYWPDSQKWGPPGR